MGENMSIKRINGFKTALTAAVTASATSMTVADGSRLALVAGDFYIMTLYKNTAFEIVKVTAVAGNTLSIERAQEGSTALEWAAGTEVVCAPTAEGYENHGGAENEGWYSATSNAIEFANGSKQKRKLSANGALKFTLDDGQMINLLLNPATFIPTFKNVTWKVGSVESIVASAFNDILIENIGGSLYAYFVA